MQQDNKPDGIKKRLLKSIKSIVITIIVAIIAYGFFPHSDIRAFQREIESGDISRAVDIYTSDILGDDSKEAEAASTLNKQLRGELSKYAKGSVSAQSVLDSIDKISSFNDVIQIIDTIDSYYELYVAISESKAVYELGEESYNKEDYKNAIDNFSKVIIEDTENYEDAQELLNKSISLYQDNVITRVKELASDRRYDEAKVLISEAELVVGSTPELHKLIAELKTQQISENISLAFLDDNYSAVISEYAQARDDKDIVLSTEIEDIYTTSVAKFLEDAESKAKEAFGSNKDFETAIDVLKNLSSQVKEDANVVASINSMIEEYKEYIPIELLSLDYIQKGQYIDVGTYVNDTDVNGNQYDRNSVICPSGGSLNTQYASNDDEAAVLYYLNQEYSTLSGLIYRPYSSLSCDFEWTPTTVRIYGDDVLIYESPSITQETYDTIKFTADVTGVRTLKIVMRGVWGRETPGWVGLVEYYPKACLTNLMIQK